MRPNPYNAEKRRKEIEKKKKKEDKKLKKAMMKDEADTDSHESGPVEGQESDQENSRE